MAHRRGSFVGRGGISQSQRRKKAWGGFSVADSPTDVVTQLIELNVTLPGVSTPEEAVQGVAFTSGIPEESTLMRVRGSLLLTKSDFTGPLRETFAFGIGVLETGAALLGSFPNPASPSGANWDGWMFYRSLTTAILDAEASIMDVKSMRKIQSGYSLVFVLGGHAMTTDDSVPSVSGGNAQIIARGLFLLP